MAWETRLFILRKLGFRSRSLVRSWGIRTSPMWDLGMSVGTWITAVLAQSTFHYATLLPMLKLQYFGHLMRRANSLEKTLMLGKTEGRRGRQRRRWLDSITNSMDLNLSKLCKTAEDRGAWCATVHRVAKSWTRLSDWLPTVITSAMRTCQATAFLWASVSTLKIKKVFACVIVCLQKHFLIWCKFE